ncbi:MAG: sigma-70 family RNA polymerase sigma factor [Chloroflexi bacterium]|nr:sigma-70 family RNA polymerase sigma factor [Chloroflexota bacterium]
MPEARPSQSSNEANPVGERTDGELVRAALVDRAAFATLYEQYLDRVYGYHLRSLGHREDAEDLTSVTFASALEKLGTFRGPSFPAWLFAIARNARTSHVRRPSAARLHEETEALADPGPNPLAVVLDSEAVAVMRRLIGALAADERELLSLRVAGHLSNAGIGHVVGKSEGAVTMQLHRVIRGLHARYRATMDEPERSA